MKGWSDKEIEERKKVEEQLLAAMGDHDEARALLHVPMNTPIVPALLELIRERNDARNALATYEQEGIAELRALQDLFLGSVEGKFEKAWVREMLRKGFIPSLANDKLRKEAREAEAESQRWHDVISRLRTYFDIPDNATHADAPTLVRDALIAAEVRGARWMEEEGGDPGMRDIPEKVCEKRRDPEWMK